MYFLAFTSDKVELCDASRPNSELLQSYTLIASQACPEIPLCDWSFTCKETVG